MPRSIPPKETNPSFFKDLPRWILWASNGFQPLFRHLREDLEERIDRYARQVQKRLLWLALCGATLLLCVFLAGFGILFILIDFFTLPRGIACLCCALLAGLFLALFFRSH